ncbi:MAG: acyltransferase [Gemmatimonadaceae bacterium]|nr:acyltransferase [Gemmatimonadaceae bacterium]
MHSEQTSPRGARATGRSWGGLTELWQRPRGQLPALDALRAAAVLLVIGSHYTEEFAARYAPVVAASRFRALPTFNWGWTGVDLFFVLSGYLIGRQLWRERLETGTVRFGRFILRRGFRIWPLYFFMLLAYAVTGYLQVNVWDVLFLSNYKWGGLSRGWSLSTEEQFYIIVPLLLIATRRVRRPAVYAWGMAGLLVAVWLSRWMALQDYAARGFTGRALSDALYAPLHLHCEPLLAGLAIAFASVVRPDWFRASAERRGVSKVGLGIFVGASALGIALRTLNKNVFPFTALGLIYGSLALWLMLDRSWIQRVASWRVFYPVSRLSYGMYLNHFYVLPSVTVWTIAVLRSRGASEPLWFFGGLLVGALVSMLVAAATFLLVERPFLLLRDRLLGTRHVNAAPTHAAEPARGEPAPAVA